jgi:hypothetical protein
MVEPDVAVGIRFKSLGLYIGTSNIAGIQVNVNGIQNVGGYIAPDTWTTISGSAAVVAEVGVSYGFNGSLFSENENIKKMDLGLTIKGIGGISKAINNVALKDLDSFAEDDLEVNEFEMSEVEFTFDLGIKYSMFEDKLVLGLVGKNLTGPKIKADAADTYASDIKIDPMVRFGLAYKPFSRLTLSSDIDLTENKVYGNYKSQNLSAGLEIRPFNWKRFDIPIRVGYSTNLAESSASDMIRRYRFLFRNS